MKGAVKAGDNQRGSERNCQKQERNEESVKGRLKGKSKRE